MRAGCEAARELIERGAERVVIVSLREALPIRKVITAKGQASGGRERSSVSAIVLAAGVGRRMAAVGDAASKLALRLGEKSILRRVVEAALASLVDEVVVVLGHGAAELAPELPHDPRVRSVYNPDFASGQSSSLKAGIKAITHVPGGESIPEAQAAIFLLGDQPLISPRAIAALVAAFGSRHNAIVRPSYRGAPGNPVLFSRTLFAELLEVTGDQGGRELLARHRSEIEMVELNLESPVDIDTSDDYAKLVSKLHDLEKL